jgi:co-chaperonin GroES (HSP10)
MRHQKESVKVTGINGTEILDGRSLVPVIFYDDRVLIEHIPADKKVDKNIHKPLDAKEPYAKGIVVSIGTGADAENSFLKIYQLKLNQTVAYFAGQAMLWELDGKEHEGKIYHLVRASDIFADL